MMKRLNLTLLLVLALTALATAQSDALLDKMAQEACTCLEAKKVDAMSMDQLQAEMGLCLMKSMGNNQKEVEALKLDFANQAAMQAFGEKIGQRMAYKCPELMMRLATVQGGAAPAAAQQTITGTLQGVEGQDLAFLKVEGEDGTTYQFLWLGEFPGAAPLVANPAALNGKRVKVTYGDVQAYSPRLKKYLTRKEVKKLEVVQ